MADPDPLNRLSEAVADGEAIDWHRVHSLAATGADRLVIEQLRVLAAICTVHQTTDAWAADTIAPTVEVRPPADAIPWGALLILEQLGEGSFGRVYRALDPRLQREVALKVLRVKDDSAPGQLVSEARLLARVRHPNVVTVYGADIVNGEVGLWMELIHGRSLAAWVAADGALGAHEAALIGATLCSALAAVHQAGLLHRDIKAQNVMREAGGRVVLMDFGAGRDLLDRSTASRPVGTPVYLAPEILAGKPASAQSDIYSLGVLLFFLTTGRYPVMAATLDELRALHARGDVIELRDLRSDLPAAFVEVVSRAVASNPQDRYESAGRFEQALRRLLHTGEHHDATIDRRPQRAQGRRVGVRHIAMATAVALAALAMLYGPQWGGRPGADSSSVPSIAVLPLRNLSGDASKDYLADSLTDVLITHLTKIKGLRVLSYLTVAALKNEPRSPGELGKSLGVGHLIVGAVAVDGASIRTTVQLIDASSGTSLWATDFTRDPSGLLNQQAEIATTVAAHLRIDLTPDLASRFERKRQVPAEAQDYYFRGLAESHRPQPAAPAAVQAFQRAVEVDPSFAEAWASLSFERVRLANQSPGPDKDALYQTARSEALTAINLDPALGLGHTALANIRFYRDWDWSGASDSYQKAVALSPGSTSVQGFYAMFLAATGRPEDAIVVGQAAQALEPLTPVLSSNLSTLFHFARRYPEAIHEAERALELSPGYPPATFRLCVIYASLGRFDDAMARCRESIAAGNRIIPGLELARVLALSGKRPEAQRALSDVLALPQGPYIGPDNIAFVHAALGEMDLAFALLEDALARRSGNLLWIQVDSRFDPLRDDVRFTPFAERVLRGTK